MNKQWRVVWTFIVSSIALAGLSHLASHAGVPHDVIAMIGIGLTIIGGLATFAYLLLTV